MKTLLTSKQLSRSKSIASKENLVPLHRPAHCWRLKDELECYDNRKFELIWALVRSRNPETFSRSIIVCGIYCPPKTKQLTKEEIIYFIGKCVNDVMIKYPKALIVLAGDVNKLDYKSHFTTFQKSSKDSHQRQGNT